MQRAFGILVVVLVTMAATQAPSPADQLAVAEARWMANKPAAYEFTLKAICFCPAPGPDAVFRVRNGTGSLVKGSVEQWPFTRRPGDTIKYSTVEGQFSLIREMLKSQPYGAQTQYDPVLGYPRRVFIDPDQLVADEEYGFEVEGFATLAEE